MASIDNIFSTDFTYSGGRTSISSAPFSVGGDYWMLAVVAWGRNGLGTLAGKSGTSNTLGAWTALGSADTASGPSADCGIEVYIKHAPSGVTNEVFTFNHTNADEAASMVIYACSGITGAIGASVSTAQAQNPHVTMTPSAAGSLLFVAAVGRAGGTSQTSDANSTADHFYQSDAIGVDCCFDHLTSTTADTSPITFGSTGAGLNNGLGTISYGFELLASAVGGPINLLTATNTTSAPSISLPSSGILPADRATVWNPGLASIGGIPIRNTIYVTLHPNGADDTAQIQNAINNCPVGQVVFLAAGTYTVNSGNTIFLNHGVTLRGAGPSLTILQKTDGAKLNTEATGAIPTPIIIVGPVRWGPGPKQNVSNFTVDGAKGSFTVTVANAALFTVGEYVRVDEMSGASWQTDPGGRGQVLASSDFRVTWQLHNPGQGTDDPISYNSSTGVIGNGSDAASWFCRQDRPTSEVKKILAINGNVLTFETPLHIDYRVSHTAQVSEIDYNFVENAGVEHLKLIGGDYGNIRFTWAAYCWALDVENTIWHDEGFAIYNSYKIELRSCFVHDAAWPQPGGAGYAISISDAAAEVLVEDCISLMANKVMVVKCAGAGSVFGYNYVDDGFINTNGTWQEAGLNASHMVGPHHVLFEGNYGFNAASDKTHGNSIYHTYLRNYMVGRRKAYVNPHDGITYNDFAANTPDGPLRCVDAGFYSYWMSYIGNVLGIKNNMSGWVYERKFTDNVVGGIWMLGWDDWSPYPTDPAVRSTAIRHGNYDYLTNSQIWDPTITDQVIPNSYYLSSRPAAFTNSYVWPWVDPYTGSIHALPAYDRFNGISNQFVQTTIAPFGFSFGVPTVSVVGVQPITGLIFDDTIVFGVPTVSRQSSQAITGLIENNTILFGTPTVTKSGNLSVTGLVAAYNLTIGVPTVTPQGIMAVNGTVFATPLTVSMPVITQGTNKQVTGLIFGGPFVFGTPSATVQGTFNITGTIMPGSFLFSKPVVGFIGPQTVNLVVLSNNFIIGVPTVAADPSGSDTITDELLEAIRGSSKDWTRTPNLNLIRKQLLAYVTNAASDLDQAKSLIHVARKKPIFDIANGYSDQLYNTYTLPVVNRLLDIDQNVYGIYPSVRLALIELQTIGLPISFADLLYTAIASDSAVERVTGLCTAVVMGAIYLP